MKLYWPSSKVYFFGKFSLFASDYEAKELGVDSLDGFFPNLSIKELITTLKKYEKDGYFKLSIIFSDKYIEQEIAKLKMSSMAAIVPGARSYNPGKNYGLGIAYERVKAKHALGTKELEFILGSFRESELEQYIRITINDIDAERFKNELTEYLKQYQNDLLTTGGRVKPERFNNQAMKLVLAMQRRFAKEGYRPIISITDIWSDYKQPNSTHTFWELIISQEILQNNIKIINMSNGNDLVINKYRGAILRTNLKGLPYAEFEIIDSKIKDFMTYRPKPKTPIVKAESSIGGLVASTDGRIWLNGKDLNLRYQLRNLCRLLIKKSPEILLLDEIIQNVDIIDPNRVQKDPVKNVQKYISELRKSLGNEFEIRNDEQEGYKLLLRSDLKSE